MTRKIFKALVILLLAIPISVFVIDSGVSLTEIIRAELLRQKIKKVSNVDDVYIDRSYRYLKLEDISVFITTKEQNDICLKNIYSKNFNILEDIIIEKINYEWFMTFADNDFKYGLNIGKGSPIESTLGLEFNTLEDIIMSLDSVSNYVDGLKPFPEYNYLQGDDEKCHIVKIRTERHYHDHLVDYLGFNHYQDLIIHLNSQENDKQ